MTAVLAIVAELGKLLAGIVRFAPLASVLVALGGGALTAGGAAWAIRGHLFDTFERPAIIKATQTADAVAYEAAADAAQKAFEAKLFKIADDASVDALQRQAADDAWQQQQVTELQQEIADYEKSLGPSGHVGLTQHDLDFLSGLRQEPR